MPFPGEVAQRFGIRGAEEQVVVVKQTIKPRKPIFASRQVSFEKHGTPRQRRVAVGAPAAALCRIHIMFVRREDLSRRHKFAETPQPANFAR